MTGVLTLMLASAGGAEALAQSQGAQKGGQGQGAQKSQAQKGGQGQGAQKAQKGGQGQGPQKAQAPRGQGAKAQPQNGRADARKGNDARGRSAARLISRPAKLDRLPQRFRALATSDNNGQRAAGVAFARGLEYGDLSLKYAMAGDRVRLMNERDELLLDLSDDDARNLGYWDVRRLDPRGVDENAPAFCRSGAGHPVWGREWCMDKGFGLGASNDDWLWGRHRPDDIVFRRDDDRLALERGGIIDVLGDVVFNRLALHAVTLGLADPLAGRWIGEPAGPRVMQLDSGGRPVAELVDWDRDGRVDVMYVASR